VTSLGKDISLRQIAGLKTDALMMSLSGAELGELAEGGLRPCWERGGGKQAKKPKSRPSSQTKFG